MSIKLQPGEELVVEVSFNPAWKKYSLVISMITIAFLVGMLALFVLLPDLLKNGKVGIVPLLIVLAPLALWYVAVKWWVERHFQTLECYLTSRSLVYRRGVFWKTEKTIPLTRIQDLGMMQGPLMRAFGIHRLKIETAGQSTPGGSGEAALIGVVDALEFRDRVLGLRDSLDVEAPGLRDGLGQVRSRAAASTGTATGDLSEIHETLKRIENHLARLADNQPGTGSRS
tara:strand:- start:2094 stop:2777 length:684 start_codon:yes stop_codon:yes gene_type:complete